MAPDRLFGVSGKGSRHVGLVEGECGGTVGLVTMEGLFETLPGTEIMDQHDRTDATRALTLRRARVAARLREGLATPDDEPPRHRERPGGGGCGLIRSPATDKSPLAPVSAG